MTDENTIIEKETISIVDLKNILIIIDKCAVRGAFKADEMKSIGELYNKIMEIVKNNNK